MDSGNSGSVQSSSGGDQEYDSRAAALSLTQPPSASLSTSNTLPPTLFDPFSHAYNNFDLTWPNYQNTLPPQSSPSLLGSTQNPFPGPSATGSPEPAARPDPPAPGAVKNSRKRTRASRRAPTTVLTTDTSNFRQMVQEFTGIPAPPFSAAATSSSPFSRRLDLFSGGSLGQYYPFRPSAQKVTSASLGNVIPENSAIAATVTSSNIFSNPYNQLMPNTSDLGYNNNSLQNQLMSREPLVFGSSKREGDSLGEMGINQDHINENLSAFLSEGKGIGRDNNEGRVQENNAITTRNEEGGLNSWNYSQDLSR